MYNAANSQQSNTYQYPTDKKVRELFEVPTYLLGYDISVKANGKVYPVTCHESTQGARRYSSTLSLTSTLHGGGWLAPHSGRFIPGLQTLYHPLYRKLGGLQCQTERVRTISPPPGFKPRTVQPVASRHLVYVC